MNIFISDSIDFGNNTEVLPEPKSKAKKNMPEFIYKIDPFTGKTFKHFPYRPPKKKSLQSASREFGSDYKEPAFNIDKYVPTNYNTDHRTSFEQMIDKKKNDARKSQADNAKNNSIKKSTPRAVPQKSCSPTKF